MKIFRDKTNSFLNSYYYPILVFIAVLISHTFSLELLGLIVISISAALGFIVCDNVRFLIAPLTMFTLNFSEKTISNGTYITRPYLVAIIIYSVFLLSVIVAHFIIHKKQVDFCGLVSSKLFLGFVAICSAFLLNGLFNFNEYVYGNIIYSIALVVSFGLIFLLFRTNYKSNSNNKNYMLYVLYLVSILATLQFFLGFISQIKFNNGEIVKESVVFGWGMWNNMGGLLTMLLPIHFYFASTVKKYGILFYISGGISYLAIILSLSRSSLLVSTFIIIVSALISCFCGENKKTNRIITGAIAIVGIVGIIVLWDKISNILGDYLSRGLDDNGRFDIYKRGLENFLKHPVFGGGFHSAVAQDYQFVSFLPDRYHNTIIQIMATCGIVGILAYLYHRYETIILFWKKRSLFSAFCGLCILGLLLTSLLDNHMFNIYPTFIYSIILAVIDSDNSVQTKFN